MEFRKRHALNTKEAAQLLRVRGGELLLDEGLKTQPMVPTHRY